MIKQINKLEEKLSLLKSIEKKNKAFKSATKMQKRVIIAKDVIESINSGLFKAEAGTYFIINKTEKEENLKDNTQLQEVICNIDNTNPCEVCAIGSIFASKIKINNSFKISDADSYGYDTIEVEDTKSIEALSSIFTKKTIKRY